LKVTDKIQVVDHRYPDERTIGHAAGIIQRGGVVIFPTRGLYGMGADAASKQAVERIFTLKGRDKRKPLLLLVADMGSLNTVAVPPAGAGLHLIRTFWPGKVTFIVPARPHLLPALTGGGATIGVRIPGHPVAAALVNAVGRPLTGTSANLSDADGCADVGRLDPALVAGVDGILDAGPLKGGSGSTVVDITGKTPAIVREGAVRASEIMDALDQYQRSILTMQAKLNIQSHLPPEW
jgi:L-threonylcarbamoyladenylate synthase